MNDTLKSWWRTRTLREQRLLLAMLGLATVVLVWLLIVRPLGDALSAAKERHGAAAQAVAEARAQASLISGLERSAPAAAAAGPIDAIVTSAATEAGFPITRLERDGAGRATMVSNSVRPQAFFAWVDQMEASRGVVVERLSTTANSDQTLSATITFRTRGR